MCRARCKVLEKSGLDISFRIELTANLYFDLVFCLKVRSKVARLDSGGKSVLEKAFQNDLCLLFVNITFK